MTAMPKTRRRNRNPKPDHPRLPGEFRSFDAWLYPGGLREYLAALSAQTTNAEFSAVLPIMNAAGLSAALWYRTMMEKG